MNKLNPKTIAKARRICAKYKVKLHLIPLGYCYAKPYTSEIFLVNRMISDKDFLTALFHEVQHVLNYRNGKYKLYHSGKFNRKQFLYWALSAERYTDRQAEKLAKFHNFHEFTHSYKEPWAKQFILNVANQMFPGEQ